MAITISGHGNLDHFLFKNLNSTQFEKKIKQAVT